MVLNQIQVALLKLYKEYQDSAFNLWKGGKAQTIADYVAAGPDAKDALKAFLAAHKEVCGKCLLAWSGLITQTMGYVQGVDTVQ